MKLIPPERYPNLIQLINKTYTDEVEQILSAGADENGTIICLAQDGNKQLAIEIGDDDIQIRLFNPQAITGQTAQMAAPEKFAPDLVDSYVDRLKQQFPFKPWLQQAKELLMQSPSLEAYSAKLVDLYPEMPSGDFNQIMLDALTAASMAGYFDAESEMGEEAEFKLPEGSTRRRNGVDYTLQSSRWHRSEVQEAPEKKPRYARASDIYELTSEFESEIQALDDAFEKGLKEGMSIDDVSALYGRKAVDSIGDRFIHGLMQLGDRDLAEERVAKIDHWGMNGEQLHNKAATDAADFYQLLDRDLGIEKISPSGQPRACAILSKNWVNLPNEELLRDRRWVQFHEMAHFAEHRDPEAGKLAEDWVNGRAKGAPMPLSQLTGNSNYRDDEKALPDNFVDPYAGKLYGNGITEVYSMGLQAFASGRMITDFYRRDPEHFDLMMRFIRK